mgnify:FL=1
MINATYLLKFLFKSRGTIHDIFISCSSKSQICKKESKRLHVDIQIYILKRDLNANTYEISGNQFIKIDWAHQIQMFEL